MQTQRTTCAVFAIKRTRPAHRNPIRKRLIVTAACVVVRLLDEALGPLSAVVSSCEGGGQTQATRPRRAAREGDEGRSATRQQGDGVSAPIGVICSQNRIITDGKKQNSHLLIPPTWSAIHRRHSLQRLPDEASMSSAALGNDRRGNPGRERNEATCESLKERARGKRVDAQHEHARGQGEGAAESIMLLRPLRGPQRARTTHPEAAKMGGGVSSLSGTRRREMRGQAKQSVDEINGMGERTHRLVDEICDLNVRAAHRCFVLAAKMTYVQLARPVLRPVRLALVNVRCALGLNSKGSEDRKSGADSWVRRWEVFR
ncbi:hypothetical protein B0H14DRAFT_3147340 [Mycena olivaceomarginata]|nr:hypothetical protein B0H14DRAFT_3147340 [Mycena olivaceomarginata]